MSNFYGNMSVDDNERRDIAKKLRELAENEFVSRTDISNALGLVSSSVMMYTPQSMKRLADLIEPSFPARKPHACISCQYLHDGEVQFLGHGHISTK